MEDTLRSSATIADLPDEILSEVFFELSVAHQERLRRVSKKWLAELSHARLQKVVRVDLSLTVIGLDPDYVFDREFCMPTTAASYLQCSSASYDRYSDYYDLLCRVVTSRCTTLQLTWTESTDSYNLMESMAAWFVVWSLFSLIKATDEDGQLGEGCNVTHLLLDNIVAPDGLHNLVVLAKDWKGQEVNRWVEYTPVALSTVVFRRCHFELFGHFSSLYRHSCLYQDCKLQRVPADCVTFARIPLRVLRLYKPKNDLEEHIKLSAIRSYGQLSPAMFNALTAKVFTLTDKAKLRWKKELTRNECLFKNLECSDVDLNSVSWSELQNLTLFFFLSFQCVKDDQ